MSIFKDLVADLELTGSMLTKEQTEANTAKHARQERLDYSQMSCCITDGDVRRIVAGKLDDTYALRVVRRWLDPESKPLRTPAGNPARFLIMLGEKGLGKTVAAAWAIAEHGGQYLSGPALRDLAMSTSWQDRETRLKMLKTRLLILDDMGTEDLAGAALSYFGQLINERQGPRFYTLITGNLKAADLESRYDERTKDRLKHQGIVAQVTGDSMRAKQPALKAV